MRAKPLRVMFWPSWPENPYQELLASHLAARGVRVEHGRRRLLLNPVHILRRGIDVLHIHSAAKPARAPGVVRAHLRASLAALSLGALRLCGVRIVWTAHDLHDHDRRGAVLDHVFTWTLARLASAIITHGESATRLVRQRYRLGDSTRFSVVPHGPFTCYARTDVDAGKVRRRLGIPKEDFVFLFLGAIREYKGLLELVASFRELRDRDVHLVIRGRVWEPALGERLQRATEGCESLHFAPGFVPDDEVAEYMEACDVAVVPYRRILTSGSVLLATSLGRPCVAPRMGTIPDQIDDRCGFLYPPDVRDALLQAMRTAIAQRGRLPEMGKLARERALRDTWDRAADLTLSVYRDCLGAPKC